MSREFMCIVVNIELLICCSINGNDTCTELLLESKGPVIVNLPDAKGRSVAFGKLFFTTCHFLKMKITVLLNIHENIWATNLMVPV